MRNIKTQIAPCMRNIYITAQEIYYAIEKGQKTETLQKISQYQGETKEKMNQDKKEGPFQE